MTRREYSTDITVNSRRISKAIIDPHYELKHGDTIDDSIVPKLVSQLSGKSFEPESESGSFQYFVADGLEIEKKKYRLIWLLEKEQIYIGVVNVYRRR